MCEHNFILEEGNEDWQLKGLGETLEKDLICQKCKLKAREIWVYSCIIDENDKEVV